MNTDFKLIKTSLVSAIFLGLYGCGGDSSNTSNNGRGADGFLTVSITDAAVDNAQEVFIQFKGISIKPTNGDAIDILFENSKNIDLLSLQGTKSTDLALNEPLSVGSYDWMRLLVNAELDGINDSFIRLDDGSVHELSIPSGSQTGLKINTSFELTASNNLDLMIDFDLRKSVVLSNGKYKLRPTLRLVDMADTGNIVGSIDPSLLTAANCSDTDPSTANVVYLFAGANVIPDDLDNIDPEAITSANVELNPSTGNYEYVIGFVPAGDYTLAFTCQSDLDIVDSSEEIEFSFVENVTVISELTESVSNPIR